MGQKLHYKTHRAPEDIELYVYKKSCDPHPILNFVQKFGQKGFQRLLGKGVAFAKRRQYAVSYKTHQTSIANSVRNYDDKLNA